MTETKPRSMLLAAAALCIAGMTLAACAAPAAGPANGPAALRQTPDATAKYTLPPGNLLPDGTLANGLLPENWSETS